MACSDPFGLDTTPTSDAISVSALEERVCAASEEWLPNTPPVDLFEPLPHPAPQCPFYRAAWQNFLIATAPDASGTPALRAYATVDTLFPSSKPRAERRAWLGDIKQAGGRQIAIDQNGRTLYYGIHVNQEYADFVAEQNLLSVEAIQRAPERLFFPAGVVELKSAWQDISGARPEQYADYITTTALVPTLSQDENGQIREDWDQPREIEAALLALHVAFTLPGHPEFIWSTFEHSIGAPDISTLDGRRDVAPTSLENPPPNDPYNLRDRRVLSDRDALLYRAGTPANESNQPFADADLELEAPTQSFPHQRTSIYRMFPASKSHTTQPDPEVSSLNFNVQALFQRKQSELGARDKRGFYRLVGAVWLDRPEYFTNDASLNNDEGNPLLGVGTDPETLARARRDLEVNGIDSVFSLLGGEDRLSSTAMESFTQAPGAFPNCFSCHNTRAVTARGAPANRDGSAPVLVGPKRLNVSHVLSQFVQKELEE